MAADHAAQQALVTQMIEAATPPVTLPGAIDQGEAARPAGAEEARLQAGGQCLRVPDADEPADGHGRTVRHRRHGRVNGGNLARR